MALCRVGRTHSNAMPLTRESSHLVELIYVLNEAKSQARERKRRVRQRLAALQRDTPIRGPWLWLLRTGSPICHPTR